MFTRQVAAVIQLQRVRIFVVPLKCLRSRGKIFPMKSPPGGFSGLHNAVLFARPTGISGRLRDLAQTFAPAEATRKRSSRARGNMYARYI